jgi:hypothetical protein
MWIAGTGVFELQRTTVYLGETFLRGRAASFINFSNIQWTS